MSRCAVAVALWAALHALSALAIDTLETRSGKILCAVRTTTASAVSVETHGATKSYAVNDILSITYGGEPPKLSGVRNLVRRGKYDEAAETLEGLTLSDSATKPMQDDLAYYKALVAARRAMAGNGDVRAAGRMMIGFLQENPTSYHFYEGCDVIAEMLVSQRAYKPAVQYYGKLAGAPFPDYKIRALVSVGRVQLLQNQPAEAERLFDQALASPGEGDLCDFYRALARVGKARVMVDSNRVDEAIKIADETIAKVDSESAEVHACAYNVRGAAYRKKNSPKEALVAYLHTDLLFSDASSDAHAEALGNLAELWTSLKQPERAALAKERLKTLYPTSTWAAAQ